MKNASSPKNEILVFAFWTYAITFSLHGFLIAGDTEFSLDPTSRSFFPYLFGLASPAIIAIMLTPYGRRGVFLRTALSTEIKPTVITFAIVAQLLIIGFAFVVAYISGKVLEPSFLVAPGFTLLAVGQIWVVLGEELGWRAYLLPRLNSILPLWIATLVITLVWGAWHLPMFFVLGSLQQGVSPFFFMASILAWSSIHSILFDQARPSIVPNLVFHASANITLNLGLIPANLEPFLLKSYLLVGGILILYLMFSKK